MKYLHSVIFILLAAFLIINGACSADEKQEQEAAAPSPVHPAFDLTADQLAERILGEPAVVTERITQRPQVFLELIHRALQIEEWALVLVDKDHSLPEEYAPADLVSLREYPLTLNRDTLQLRRICMPDVLAMTEAARAEGIELVFSSTYRSYEYQEMLYTNYVAQYGQEEANRFSARPGTSQHQLGTTIDFGSITPEFAETPQGQWLYEHAWEYGFSLSYPEGMEDLTGYMFEIWHYRYITRTGTRLEREFFNGIQQYMTEFMDRHAAFFSKHMIGN